ncbi:MAG: galactose mutarotase [Bryobacterales bacterium]|nr:galactose mutarotase [Bryobacterales bacterium]
MIELYTLQNSNGLRARFTTYGGILLSLHVPDRDGKPRDVVLGFDSIDPYLQPHPYFGCIVGRCANRIAGGDLELNGIPVHLTRNRAPHHLHGGARGFDKAVWEAEATAGALVLRYTSPDGEEGYPGECRVTVTYTLTETNALRIDYEAVSDKDTIVNLTNHSYFNLSLNDDILDHRIRIAADAYTPVDGDTIPTGEIRHVAGTTFDLRKTVRIGDVLGKGFDHNFVLDRAGEGLVFAARVDAPDTGIGMEVWTTEPGVQFYTANFLDGSITGKGGRTYWRHAGLCLETQHFPDAPHHAHFPTITLRAGARYRSTTEYRF